MLASFRPANPPDLGQLTRHRALILIALQPFNTNLVNAPRAQELLAYAGFKSFDVLNFQHASGFFHYPHALLSAGNANLNVVASQREVSPVWRRNLLGTTFLDSGGFSVATGALSVQAYFQRRHQLWAWQAAFGAQLGNVIVAGMDVPTAALRNGVPGIGSYQNCLLRTESNIRDQVRLRPTGLYRLLNVIQGMTAGTGPHSLVHWYRYIKHLNEVLVWGAHTDLSLVILAMGYQPHEFHDTLGGRIRYITLDQPVPPAEARNICLRDFYASGYRWAALMDNDAALYHSPTHNSGYDFITEMTAQIDRYDGIGLFYPVNPMQTPFRARWEDSGYFTNHVFERGFAAKGTLVFVRNFPQFGQRPIYQDPAFTFMEDNTFAFDVLASGQTVFQNWNMVLKELVNAGPLSFFGDTGSRGPRGALARQQIAAKFASDGLRLNTSGSLNTRAMVNRCWPRGVRSMVVVPKPASPVVPTPSLVASSKKEVQPCMS